MTKSFTWTDEHDAKLREMAPDFSAKQIAEVFGVTRNAVIGRCTRRNIDLASAATKVQRQPVLRLVLKGAPPPPKRPKVFATYGGVTDATVVDQIAAARLDQREAKMITASEDWTPARITIFALKDGLCKWPLWVGNPPLDQKFFCGNKAIPGKPYCHHCAGLSISGPRVAAAWDRRLGIDKARAAA
jgi:hypothetical protein